MKTTCDGMKEIVGRDLAKWRWRKSIGDKPHPGLSLACLFYPVAANALLMPWAWYDNGFFAVVPVFFALCGAPLLLSIVALNILITGSSRRIKAAGLYSI